MNEKCNWKDEKFEPCKSAFENYIDLGNPYDSLQKVFKRGHIVKFCPFCGADIRKPEPKQPTHEEIMKPIWWRCEYTRWSKITRYAPGTKYPYYINNKWLDRKWFISCESADIPSEAV